MDQKTKEITSPLTLTENISYLAGYFDGEGCVTFSQKYRTLSVTIATADLEILNDFAKTFGGEVKPKKQKVKRSIFRWTLCNSKAQDFLLKILPYLRGKKDVALLGLVPTFGSSGVKTSNEENSLRAHIEEQIHKINQRVTV